MPVFKKTSYLHIPGPIDKPLLFYIPGNPGISEYYQDYISEINKLSGIECIVLSQLGADINNIPPYSDSSLVYTLDDQIRHQVAFLREYCTTRRSVYILGHSIGAWMAQRVTTLLKDSDNINILFVGLMTPTVTDIAKSSRGILLTRFKSYCGQLGISLLVLLSKILNYLTPSWLLQYVINRSLQGATKTGRASTLALSRRPGILRQILTMAFEEMDRVDEQIEAEEIAGFWSSNYRIWLLYADADHWVPDKAKAKVIKYAQEHSPDHLIDFMDVAHAFVLSSSVEVAQLTVKAFPSLSGDQ